MDIEQSSDQQATRDLTNNTIDTADQVVSTLDALLKKLAQMGVEKEREITIRVGPQKVYDGTVAGDGTRSELTDKQSQTLRDAFDPSANSGSVRIIDKDNQTLFHSKKGEILKNELHLLQSQIETEQPETEQVSESVSSRPPSLDDDIEGSESLDVGSQVLDVSPVLDAIDNSPVQEPAVVNNEPQGETVFETVTAPVFSLEEPIEPQPTLNVKDNDELEKLVSNQSVQIAELQARLTEVSGKLEELTEWRNSITPVKLANERLSDWMNKQRDNVASKVHQFANRIASSASQKFEQVQDQVKEKVEQGFDAHNQAVEGLKTQVSERVEQVRDSLGQQVSQGQSRHNQALGQKGKEAAEAFMNKFVSPTIRVMISQMEKVGEVTTSEDGTKTFQSDAFSWNVEPDGKTSITRKTDGNQITSENVTAGEMKVIQSMVTLVNNKYGLNQDQTHNQTQPTSPNQTQKTVQKV